MKGNDQYKADMPGVKEKPVTPVSTKVFPQEEIIAEKKPTTLKQMMPSRSCPPFEIFIVGSFLGGMVSRDHGIDL
jgi:hypothetical protein